MKALVCTRPGLLEYKEIDAPELLPGNAIIKIKRIGICGTDYHAFEGTQPFFDYPRILGHEIAGELVEADGADGFNPGESVTVIPYFNCGKCIACRNGKPNCCMNIKVLGVHINGGLTQYLSVPVSALVKSEGLRYDELALVEPLAIGAHGVRRADVQKGEFVLIIGAGPIGLGTMEFARIAGSKVIVMDVNNSRLQFCKEKFKPPYIINSTEEEPVSRLLEITNGDLPAKVIDASGNLTAINNAFQFVAHGGRFILIGLQKGMIQFSHPEFHKRELTLMSSRNATREDFEQVIKSMKKEMVNSSDFITHRVPFDGLKNIFEKWKDPLFGVIKGIVEFD